MKSLSTILLGLSLLCSTLIMSQTPTGVYSSYYSGIQGVVKNPGQAALSPYRLDINVFAVNPNVGSDYFGIDLGNLSGLSEGFDFETDADLFPKDDNNFFVRAEILGPSFMFNISPTQSIGLISRVRAFFNLNRINGRLYEDISNNFDTEEDYKAQIRNFNGNIHAWSELGAVYSHIVLDENGQRLSVGGTLKLLQGAGSLFFTAASIDADYDATNDLLTSTGDLSYGGTVDFDNDDIDFSNLTTGIGLDIGAVYEVNDSNTDEFKYRVGFSITDLGSINYKNAETNRFQLDDTVDTNIFDTDDLEEVLKINYDFTTTTEDVKIRLPAALNAFGDYRVHNNIFVAAETAFSLISNKTDRANRINNYFAVIPRMEGKAFGVYSPIGIYQYTGFNWGLGFKAGPIHIGSSTILTNLVSSRTKRVDIYIGLKIPFYRKS
jgi:Family of unknown function (DUF5723)